MVVVVVVVVVAAAGNLTIRSSIPNAFLTVN
jgi:hypothetical protein